MSVFESCSIRPQGEQPRTGHASGDKAYSSATGAVCEDAGSSTRSRVSVVEVQEIPVRLILLGFRYSAGGSGLLGPGQRSLLRTPPGRTRGRRDRAIRPAMTRTLEPFQRSGSMGISGSIRSGPARAIGPPRRRLLRAPNSARSANGTPSNSQITSEGTGNWNAETRSKGGPAAYVTDARRPA